MSHIAQFQPGTPPAEAPVRSSGPLTMAEIQTACQLQGLPLILDLEEAAALIKLKASTLKRKVSEGHFKGCVKRGKPLRFWRDRLVLQVMDTK